MDRLLLAATASLAFMDMEVFQVGGKSFVVPYVMTFALAIPLIARPARLRWALRDPVLPFLLAWVLAAAFSTIVGYWKYHGEAFLRYERDDLLSHDLTQMLNLAMMLIQYVLFACALRSVSPDRFKAVVRVFIAVGVIGSVYALYQIGFVVFGWPYREFFRTSNLYLRAETLEPGGFGGWIRVPRAFGTAPEPSLWGAYLVVIAALLLGRLTFDRRRWASGAMLLAVLGGIVVTFSRGTWLALVIVIGLWALAVLAHKLPRWAMGAIIVVALGATVWPALIVRTSTNLFEDLSALERMSAHLTGLNILFDNSLFGIGFGSIQFFIEHYAVLLPGYDEIRFISVFSFFLLVFVSTGLVGAFLFVMFLISVIRRIDAAFRIPIGDPEWKALRLGVSLAYMAVLAGWLNQSGYNFTYLWFCFALVSVMPAQIALAASDITDRANAA